MKKRSVLCVGLDPDPARLPQHLLKELNTPEAVLSFCREIIRKTAPFAIAFKINFAFFESLGTECFSVMKSVLDSIPSDVLTIADAKRGDIGNSAAFYAHSVFDQLGFDSVTISPYMGQDSVVPFLKNEGTCAFVLARTSNPGGNDFQTLSVNGQKLFEHVGKSAAKWASGQAGETGLVVGATDSEALARLRAILPSTPFLIPGIGAQGGDTKKVMAAAGTGPVLISSSRSILYASGGEDYAAMAGHAAEQAQKLLGS